MNDMTQNFASDTGLKPEVKAFFDDDSNKVIFWLGDSNLNSASRIVPAGVD